MDEIVLNHEQENVEKFAFKNEMKNELNGTSQKPHTQGHLSYRLKENHLLCIYLSIGHAPEYFADVKKYIMGICQNYSLICGNSRTLYYLVRLWLFSFV